MLDRGVRMEINKHGIDYLFKNVGIYFHSDYAIVNLECPATNDSNPQGKKYEFRADPQWLPGLQKAGIRYASLANNHSIDQGSNGLQNTAENLLKNHIIPFGWGKTPASSCEPVLKDSNGLSVALFGIDFISLEGWKPNDSSACPCMQNPQLFAKAIKNYKSHNKNRIIIIVPHWGEEYHSDPNEFQVKAAHMFIDSGADLIIGSHPHVVGKTEIYKGKYIFYSLGNFIFDQNRPGTKNGEMVKVELTPGQIESVSALKIQIDNCVPGIIE